MEAAAFSDGALTKKIKELIAIGIFIRIDCESCMQRHIEQAAANSATHDEVLEAVEVGIEMGGGPATVSACFALNVMEAVFSRNNIRDRLTSYKYYLLYASIWKISLILCFTC
jgi:AhpD family alkylhydroperoxidase